MGKMQAMSQMDPEDIASAMKAQRQMSQRQANARSSPKNASHEGRDNIDKLVNKYKKDANLGDSDSDDDEGGARRKPLVDGQLFNAGIGAIITINALVIGAETNERTLTNDNVSVIWYIIEVVFCLFFLGEQVLRITLARPTRMSYFFPVSARPLNCFDFVIVVISIIDTFILMPVGMGGTGRYAAMLRFVRLFRLVRLVRLFRIFKELWLVASGMIQALKTLVWICLICFVFMYICAIFTTITIGHNDEVYDKYFVESVGVWDHEIYFKTVWRSCLTLFQVMTLDSWSEGIARHIYKQQPLMRIFFVAFIALTNFGLLNIIIGVVVESAIATALRDSAKVKKAREKARKVVFGQLREIFEIADIDGSGTLTLTEVEVAISKPEIYNKLKMIDFPVENPKQIFMLLDYDESGELSIEEFITGCIRMKGTANSKDLLVAQVAIDCMRKKYDLFERQLSLFQEKLLRLDVTARSIVDQGEHVFMDLRQYRIRHPSTTGTTMPRVNTKDLETAPWWDKDSFPTVSDSRHENGPSNVGFMDYSTFDNMILDLQHQGTPMANTTGSYMGPPSGDVNMSALMDNQPSSGGVWFEDAHDPRGAATLPGQFPAIQNGQEAIEDWSNSRLRQTGRH